MQRSLIKIIIPGLACALLMVGCGDAEKTSNTEQKKDSIVQDATPVQVIKTSGSGMYPKHLANQIMIPNLRNADSSTVVFMYAPRTNDENMSCEDSTCTTYFSFESDEYPSFSHEMALGGAIGNAGDLDDDGICEIYFVPDWFTSAWTGLNIYSLKNGNWKKIASQDIRREEGIVEDSLSMDYDRRIIRHKGYFELVGNKMDDEGVEKLVPEKFYFK